MEGFDESWKPDNYNDKENDENLFFIDLLRQDNELTDFGDEYYEWLKSFRVAIVEGLNRYSKASVGYQSMCVEDRIEADKVFKKYRWLLTYWNHVVEDESAYYPVPDMVD